MSDNTTDWQAQYDSLRERVESAVTAMEEYVESDCSVDDLHIEVNDLRNALTNHPPSPAVEPVSGEGWEWQHQSRDDSWHITRQCGSAVAYCVMYQDYERDRWDATVVIDGSAARRQWADTPQEAIRAACLFPAIAEALCAAWERREQ